jgi:hypothetical protein
MVWRQRDYFACSNDFYLPSRRPERGGGVVESEPCGGSSSRFGRHQTSVLSVTHPLPYPVLVVVELPDEVVVGILLLPLSVLLLLVLKGIVS